MERHVKDHDRLDKRNVQTNVAQSSKNRCCRQTLYGDDILLAEFAASNLHPNSRCNPNLQWSNDLDGFARLDLQTVKPGGRQA